MLQHKEKVKANMEERMVELETPKPLCYGTLKGKGECKTCKLWWDCVNFYETWSSRIKFGKMEFREEKHEK